MSTQTHNPFLDALPDVFLELDATGQVLRHVGGGRDDPLLAPASLDGQKLSLVWPAAAAERLRNSIRKAMRTREHQVCTIELNQDGTARYELRLFVHGRDRLLAILRRHHAADTQIESRSFVDTLTGLATRERLLLELEQVIAQARLRERHVGLLCLDLDRFTRINKHFGRQGGDQVLKTAAQRIDNCLRAGDRPVRFDVNSTLARIGGDEFIVVLSIDSRDALEQVAQRLLGSFSEPFHYKDHALVVSPTIGSALFPDDADDAEALLSSARTALNLARDFGHNPTRTGAPECHLQAEDLAKELRWAVDKNQLELHYFPRVDLHDGGVSAVEALLRWRHPMRGFVPLPEVLPLAEATGLMRPIGEWALATASMMARHLDDLFVHAPIVSVNLSHREFTRPDLPELVSATLGATGIAGHRLQFEFTEAALMKHRGSTELLHRLHEMGVRLALDDFGTGHVSLTQLQALPISALKIDRSLIAQMSGDATKYQLLSAIISMALRLELTVVAEGVETEQQLHQLRELGCHSAQGFLFTRPLPGEQLVEYLRSREQAPDPVPI